MFRNFPRTIAVLLTSSVLCCFAALRPEWNFDSIGYAAAARAQLGQSMAEIHEGTFSDLRDAAPRRKYRELVESSAYRQGLANEPNRLALQIPFYASKPLYVAAVSGLHAAGVNSVRATFLVSALSYGVLGGIFVLWMNNVAPSIGWIVGLCLMLSAPVREMGGLATPDALATVFSMLALLGMQRRLFLGVIAAIACVATRPDGCLLALALIGWRAWLTPESRRLLGVGAGACIVTSALLPLAAKAYPWSVLFAHTFLKRVVDAADVTAAASVSPMSYVETVGRGLLGEYVLHPSSGLVFAAFTTILWAQLRDQPARLRREIRLLLALVWFSAVAHFLAFPMLADRFFIAHYLIVSLCALTLVGRTSEDASAALSPRVAPQKAAQPHDQQDP